MGDLTSNFSRSEFACKCGCGKEDIDEELVLFCQGVRDSYGARVNIRSGCRCESHNKNERGRPSSDHLTGEGVDIECLNSRLRYIILRAAFRQSIYRIGIHSTFIHVGKRLDNPQMVAWIY